LQCAESAGLLGAAFSVAVGLEDSLPRGVRYGNPGNLCISIYSGGYALAGGVAGVKSRGVPEGEQRAVSRRKMDIGGYLEAGPRFSESTSLCHELLRENPLHQLRPTISTHGKKVLLAVTIEVAWDIFVAGVHVP
jgi:hypothetical protein